jgi:hypothetical protein
VAFTDFYINSSGSNLNAGSSSGSPAYSSTAANGTWDGTSTFTPGDGSTPASTVSAGMWMSIYTGTPSATPYIAQVSSVAAGVNGAITLSTSNKFGTAPGSSSVAKGIVGGAWADFGIIGSSAALNTGTVTQSTRINIQAATYANTTTTLAFGMAGAATTPLWWRGYKTSPGDQDSNALAAAGTDIPSITFTTGRITISGAHQTFSNLDASGAATAGAQVGITGTAVLLYRFRATATAANSASVALSITGGSVSTFVSCYFKATTTAAEVVNCSAGLVRLEGCYITGGAIGVNVAIASILINCVCDSCGGDAIKVSNAQCTIVGCSIYAPTGHGINVTTVATNGVLIANCYFDSVNGAGKFAITNSSGTNTDVIIAVANAYFNCTGNTNGIGDFPLIFDNGTLVTSAFVAPASQNFMIKANAYALGYPGTIEKLSPSNTGYLDIGALQHQGGGMGQIMRVAGQHFPVW